MKLWKRLLAIPIAASLVMGLLPAPTLAEGTTHSHPICGKNHTDIGDHTGTCEAVRWTAWDGTSEITYDANNTAYVYLAGDVTRDVTLDIKAGYTLYLCLDGHSMTSSATDKEVIYARNGANFILCDCTGGGKITHSPNVTGRGVRVSQGGSNKASFTMYGGEISGNHHGGNGAGIETQNGTVTMYGGTISDNHVVAASNYGGGGVCAHSGGRFTMYGGTISNNESTINGGGGVTVWGGGLVTIAGGTISGNKATKDGGGIYTNGTLTISGNSVIENNEAENGGGVFYHGTYSSMTISGSAKIAGNTATGNGGGVCFENGKGTLMLNGGSITGNTATGNGGGVYFKGGAFNISGNLDISGNKKSGADNNVYLPDNKSITVAGALTGSNPIGVTTEKTPDASNHVRIASGPKNYAAPEKFSYENDSIPVSAIIKYGSTADLVVCKHNLNSTWSSDSFSHWHECSICKGKEDIAAHTYDQKTVDEQYKASPATCLSGTTYYMSCVCGAKGADTFEVGGIDPANHSGTLDPDWKSDGSKHWKEYSCCRAHAAEAAHTPGPAATEDAPQRCTVCSYELAPTLAHTHVWGAWISNGDGTHTRTCAKDSSHTETNACSGGIATCQSSAICAVCNTAYGAKDMTNHTGGTEVRGSVEATTSTEGYTGDTYCKGCNTKLADGKTIPKKDSGSSGGSSSGGTSGGTGSGNSGGNTTPSTSVTVPVSGEEKTIRVNSTVSSTTATIEDIDLSKLNTVIGNDVKTGVVTIDFSVLEKQIDTVKLPANVIKQIADAVKDPSNDAESLSIVLTDGTSIEFDEKALSKKTAQTNQTDITISIKRTTDSTLSALQQQAVGSQPAWDIKLTSGGKNISDMGGVITLHTPYELRSGEQSNGIVVYYVDENGNRESCETSYDPVKKLISWKTSHLSVYMIGYDENRVTPDTDTEDQSVRGGSQVSKLKLPILLATGKGGNRKITISWRSYEDADGYDCYWSYCDGKRSYKKLATVKAAKDRVTSRRLANNRRYKYFVAAYKLIDGKKVYIAKSNTLHVALKDAKATNAKKVTVNQTNVRLKAGDTFVIRSRTRLENTNKKELLHAAAYRYYTSDQSVASVSKTGKIKALKSGTCVIYVVANNGVYGTIKVTVN